MSTLAEQFAARDAHKPKPVWICNDRISGKIGKVTVLGSVIREDYNDSSLVLCHLDLPVKVEQEYKWIVQIPSKSIKRLKVMV